MENKIQFGLHGLIIRKIGQAYLKISLHRIKIVSAISKNQVVNLIIKPNEDIDKIKKILLRQKTKLKLVRFHKIPTNRVWIRDFGPIYLINKN